MTEIRGGEGGKGVGGGAGVLGPDLGDEDHYHMHDSASAWLQSHHPLPQSIKHTRGHGGK